MPPTATALLWLALLAAPAAQAFDELKCLELGFTSQLRCSSCEKLSTMVNDAELHTECIACCSEDLSNRVFSAARLEVCS